jgi:hypothetical protein
MSTPPIKDNFTGYPVLPDEEILDRYVNLTQAASILGYTSYISVQGLIKKKIITPYWVPGNSKKRILLSDLHQLLKESQNRATPKKRGKGRPSIL